jgi:hypothetical protein
MRNRASLHQACIKPKTTRRVLVALAGQGARLARRLPAAELVSRLVAETEEAITRFQQMRSASAA